MQHVIIGAGPAGIIAAESLKKLDPNATVRVIGDEPEPPYSRMALPYYLVKQIDEEGTYLRKTQGHFQHAGIDIVQDRVIAIKQADNTLVLSSGKTQRYDKLLIASGSHPVSPPIPGIDSPNIFPCWTLEHARNIAQRAKPGAKVVLMGAGFIGCIILEALAKSGADLTVVEMEDRMVPRMMNDTAGNMIKRWCEEKGVKVYTSTRVEAIDTLADGGLRLSLSSGDALPADMVVSATGVAPNTDFLGGTTIKIDQGILIDRNMHTNDPDIFAAGDVAQGRDFSTGQYSVQAIQPTAADHGQLAARNMLGKSNALYQGSVNMNVLDTIGLISSSFGLWMGVDGGSSAELHHPQRFRYLNLQFQEDLLVGATSLGLTQHVGVLRGLIQSKIRLGAWKDKLTQDPTRIMEAYIARTQSLGSNASLM